MNHPDQKTIELLALDSPDASRHREELAKHFSECEGCRLQYEEMREFYRTLHVVEPLDGTVQEETRPRLLAQPGFMVSRTTRMIESKGAVVALWRSIREHPRVSSGVLISSILLTSFLMCNRYKPVATSARMNVHRQMLEVFDQQSKPIWEVPAKADSTVLIQETVGHVKYTLADLSEDGDPVMVTTLELLGDDPTGRYTLRVLKKPQQVLWIKEPRVEQLTYGGISYHEMYGHVFFRVTRGADRKPMIVSAWNGTRSPSALVVYDAKGDKVGEYWHFGQLEPADTCDINGDGVSEIVAVGTNQSADDRMGFAVAVFLDPNRITSRSKSSQSPGFDLPISDAEVAYVRFPFSDLNRALHWGAGVGEFVHSGELFRFNVSTGVNDGVSKGSFTFDYFLDRHLRPISAKWDENARAYHADLLSKGLIHSRFDTTYTENLRKSVQFWNGSAWQLEPTTMKHQN